MTTLGKYINIIFCALLLSRCFHEEGKTSKVDTDKKGKSLVYSLFRYYNIKERKFEGQVLDSNDLPYYKVFYESGTPVSYDYFYSKKEIIKDSFFIDKTRRYIVERVNDQSSIFPCVVKYIGNKSVYQDFKIRCLGDQMYQYQVSKFYGNLDTTFVFRTPVVYKKFISYNEILRDTIMNIRTEQLSDMLLLSYKEEGDSLVVDKMNLFSKKKISTRKFSRKKFGAYELFILKSRINDL